MNALMALMLCRCIPVPCQSVGHLQLGLGRLLLATMAARYGIVTRYGVCLEQESDCSSQHAVSWQLSKILLKYFSTDLKKNCTGPGFSKELKC